MAKIYQTGYSYEFGVPTTEIIPGIALESIKLEQTPEFQSEGKDAKGNTIAVVVGDPKYTFTASGYLFNESTFDPVDDFTYTFDIGGTPTALTLIINNKSVTQSNTDFQKAEITGVAFTVVGNSVGVEIVDAP
mgnify:CR=1 FL=1